MGDASDNYPGCPGVGEKTAVKLINQFGNTEGLISHTDQLKGKMREKVEGAIDDIKMAKYLATIRTDVPIALNLEEMRVTPPNEQKLRALFDELEFKRMTERFLNKPEIKQKTANTQLDLFAANPTNGADEQKKSLYSSLKTTSHKYQLIDNKQEAVELYDFLRTKKNLSLDTETTSTNAIEAELVGLSLP